MLGIFIIKVTHYSLKFKKIGIFSKLTTYLLSFQNILLLNHYTKHYNGNCSVKTIILLKEWNQNQNTFYNLRQ